jgi:hypothetical protein
VKEKTTLFLNFPDQEESEVWDCQHQHLPLIGDIIEWGGVKDGPLYRAIRRVWLYNDDGDPTLHVYCERVDKADLEA